MVLFTLFMCLISHIRCSDGGIQVDCHLLLIAAYIFSFARPIKKKVKMMTSRLDALPTCFTATSHDKPPLSTPASFFSLVGITWVCLSFETYFAGKQSPSQIATLISGCHSLCFLYFIFSCRFLHPKLQHSRASIITTVHWRMTSEWMYPCQYRQESITLLTDWHYWLQ